MLNNFSLHVSLTTIKENQSLTSDQCEFEIFEEHMSIFMIFHQNS